MDNLYNEWASGASLANSNDFFEEVPTELNNPQNFSVTPEQIPDNPTAPKPEPEPVVVDQPAEPTGPQTRITKKGGNITLEKTSRGWRATLDNGEGRTPENFYANNKDELIFNICEAKIEANLAIHRLKKEKLLGGEEPVPIAVVKPKPTPVTANLTADEVYEIKNKLQDNPAEALDDWISKRFGRSPEQLAEALKTAEEAKNIVEAQQVKADVDEVNAEFIRNNPDYADKYATAENSRILVGRMAKAYLNKKITKNTPQAVVDTAIYELYTKGFWTADNLETAKEELLESGLLEPIESRRTESEPQPQPATVPTPNVPSVPPAPRIAAPPGQPVGFGISPKDSVPSEVPSDKPLTDEDLQKMPLDKLRLLAAAQMRKQAGRQ